VLAFCRYDGQSLKPIDRTKAESWCDTHPKMPMRRSWMVGNSEVGQKRASGKLSGSVTTGRLVGNDLRTWHHSGRITG
jgi:hypothetical protein